MKSTASKAPEAMAPEKRWYNSARVVYKDRSEHGSEEGNDPRGTEHTTSQRATGKAMQQLTLAKDQLKRDQTGCWKGLMNAREKENNQQWKNGKYI